MVAGITFAQTQSSSLTLIVSGGFLFSGLMFGPDLDIYSQQYKRWGSLRWIWLPYRKSMRHRSFLSHGMIVGTILRIVYLLAWIAIFGSLGGISWAIVQQLLGTGEWQILTQQWFSSSTAWIGQSLRQHPIEWLAAVVGLELGALSHSFSDWAGSAYKRLQRWQKKNPR